MLNTNDIALIQSMIACSYARQTAQTTDDVPVTVWDCQMTGAEIVDVEVICHALAVGGGFVSRMAKTFYYDGSAITQGGDWGYVTKEYLGTGLSTCDFSFNVSGDTIEIRWTGEAGVNMTASFRIYINRLFDDGLLPP